LPHYCYHPGLSIVASCRICLIEVEGLPKLVPSCQTPVRDGMVVYSNSPKAIANQKAVMEYLLINHPLDCPVCDQAGECYLQDYSYEYGRSESRFEEDKAKKPKKDIGSTCCSITTAASCARGAFASPRGVSGRASCMSMAAGIAKRSIFSRASRWIISCRGNVVDLCPVWGRCWTKDFLFKQRVWLLKQAPSISPADSGENIYIEYNEG
jgi:NADH-quinone oxidoreductase subunit G